MNLFSTKSTQIVTSCKNFMKSHPELSKYDSINTTEFYFQLLLRHPTTPGRSKLPAKHHCQTDFLHG